MPTYTHVLVGLDLSEDADNILQKAQSLATECSAQLSVAHIIEPLNFAYGGDIPMDMSDAQSCIQDQAKTKLQTLIDTHSIQTKHCRVSVGQTAAELHRLAEEFSADLIIVGCHGRHGLALLLGSTSNGVLHGTECDVLAVKI